jgi:Na+/H+ antiporter NhaD/arsenite permease-like protein
VRDVNFGSGRPRLMAVSLSAAGLLGWPRVAFAAANDTATLAVFGVPLEFILFALMLLGVAVLHHRPLTVALTGQAVIVAYQLFVTGFPPGPGLEGLARHLSHEWVPFANIMLLLVGFAILSNHFEQSNIPDAMPAILPDNWTGGLVLLGLIFVMSAFLDNIAAAVIGGVMARHVYHGKVSVGFLAAIVAAANAGGAGSVVGDTTTTIMWLHGISPATLLWAYVAAVPAFLVVGLVGAWSQHRFEPIQANVEAGHPIDWMRAVIVAVILISVIAANVGTNLFFTGAEEHAPILGLALWLAILVTAALRRPDWRTAPAAIKGAGFLVALVAAASLMPVAALPDPSWTSTLGLGLLSSVFDNIPLTALALEQGGYDWALLAYAVGYGGSMVWFGSSAGVALTNLYPEGRSVLTWLREGWIVLVGYFLGFFVMLLTLGWHPGN